VSVVKKTGYPYHPKKITVRPLLQIAGSPWRECKVSTTCSMFQRRLNPRKPSRRIAWASCSARPFHHRCEHFPCSPPGRDPCPWQREQPHERCYPPPMTTPTCTPISTTALISENDAGDCLPVNPVRIGAHECLARELEQDTFYTSVNCRTSASDSFDQVLSIRLFPLLLGSRSLGSNFGSEVIRSLGEAFANHKQRENRQPKAPFALSN
jgi:hypothetical protein